MQEVRVRFEQDKALDHIDVVIRAGEQTAQIEQLLQKLAQNTPRELTVLDDNSCTCVIKESDVITVSAAGKQVRFLTARETYHARQSLQEAEETLSERTFQRISRYELINLKKVRKYDFTLGGTLRIEFENGTETWASRRYIPVIREKLMREEES